MSVHVRSHNHDPHEICRNRMPFAEGIIHQPPLWRVPEMIAARSTLETLPTLPRFTTLHPLASSDLDSYQRTGKKYSSALDRGWKGSTCWIVRHRWIGLLRIMAGPVSRAQPSQGGKLSECPVRLKHRSFASSLATPLLLDELKDVDGYYAYSAVKRISPVVLREAYV